MVEGEFSSGHPGGRTGSPAYRASGEGGAAPLSLGCPDGEGVQALLCPTLA